MYGAPPLFDFKKHLIRPKERRKEVRNEKSNIKGIKYFSKIYVVYKY